MSCSKEQQQSEFLTYLEKCEEKAEPGDKIILVPVYFNSKTGEGFNYSCISIGAGNCLFLFGENSYAFNVGFTKAGKGSAVVRPIPNAVGIVTGTATSSEGANGKGFPSLKSSGAMELIERSIEGFSEAARSGSFRYVVYPCSGPGEKSKDLQFGSGIFSKTIGSFVMLYIMRRIKGVIDSVNNGITLRKLTIVNKFEEEEEEFEEEEEEFEEEEEESEEEEEEFEEEEEEFEEEEEEFEEEEEEFEEEEEEFEEEEEESEEEEEEFEEEEEESEEEEEEFEEEEEESEEEEETFDCDEDDGEVCISCGGFVIQTDKKGNGRCENPKPSDNYYCINTKMFIKRWEEEESSDDSSEKEEESSDEDDSNEVPSICCYCNKDFILVQLSEFDSLKCKFCNRTPGILTPFCEECNWCTEKNCEDKYEEESEEESEEECEEEEYEEEEYEEEE
jgi:hypothetical protein